MAPSDPPLALRMKIAVKIITTTPPPRGGSRPPMVIAWGGMVLLCFCCENSYWFTLSYGVLLNDFHLMTFGG